MAGFVSWTGGWTAMFAADAAALLASHMVIRVASTFAPADGDCGCFPRSFKRRKPRDCDAGPPSELVKMLSLLAELFLGRQTNSKETETE
jgi:hypothetical protein